MVATLDLGIFPRCLQFCCVASVYVCSERPKFVPLSPNKSRSSHGFYWLMGETIRGVFVQKPWHVPWFPWEAIAIFQSPDMSNFTRPWRCWAIAIVDVGQKKHTWWAILSHRGTPKPSSIWMRAYPHDLGNLMWVKSVKSHQQLSKFRINFVTDPPGAAGDGSGWQQQSAGAVETRWVWWIPAKNLGRWIGQAYVRIYEHHET